MAWTLIAYANAAYTSASSGATTPAQDTTGAKLIIVAINGYGTGGTFSDNKGNTWTALTAYNTSNLPWLRRYYCVNPTVGSGHTFTLSDSNVYGDIQMQAWGGVDVADALEAQTGTTKTNGVSPLSSGAISPANDGALVIAHYAGFANPLSFNGSPAFTVLTNVTGVDAVHYTKGGAYYVQSTAGSINSGWSWTGSLSGTNHIATIVAFNAAAAPSIEGAADIDEAGDTASGTGALDISGAASVGEAGDTLAGDGALDIEAAGSVTEGDDTLSAAGQGLGEISGSADLAEDDDTASASGELPITGATDATEAGDEAGGASALAIRGAVSSEEGDDALSATGGLPIGGALDTGEADDALTGAGKLSLAGTLDANEGDDTAPGATPVGTWAGTGVASVIEQGDAPTASAVLAIVGAVEALQAADTVSAALYRVFQPPAGRTLRFGAARATGRAIRFAPARAAGRAIRFGPSRLSERTLRIQE